jgi:hypothetical protein
MSAHPMIRDLVPDHRSPSLGSVAAGTRRAAHACRTHRDPRCRKAVVGRLEGRTIYLPMSRACPGMPWLEKGAGAGRRRSLLTSVHWPHRHLTLVGGLTLCGAILNERAASLRSDGGGHSGAGSCDRDEVQCYPPRRHGFVNISLARRVSQRTIRPAATVTSRIRISTR